MNFKKTSPNARGLITAWEGSIPTVYNDVAGLPTIGVGHLLSKSELSSGKIILNGTAVKYRNALTSQQIDVLLTKDLTPAEHIINTDVKVVLSQCQFDALVAFVFNVGNGAFAGSTLLRLLNAGQYDQVPAQLMRWVHANGEVIQGLVNRRAGEVKLWNGEI